MHVTLVLLLIIFFQLSQATRPLYLCSCPPYQDKVITDGTNNCSECEPMPGQHNCRELGLRVSLVTGVAKHKWTIRGNRKLVENVSLTMYRLTDDYHARKWLPLEGCIDIPLQDEECFPTKCDDLYDRRVILRKGNDSYVDLMPYSRICTAHECKQTTIDIKILNFTLTSFSDMLEEQALKIEESAKKCYFYLDKGRVNEHGGNFSKDHSNQFDRKVFVLSSEVNEFHVNYEEEYVLDLTTCLMYHCEVIPKLNSSIESIVNYEFPTSNNNNSLVCLSIPLSSNKADIYCMEPKPTDTVPVTTVGTTTSTPRQILIAICSALGMVLVIISVACCASWQRTQRNRKEYEKMKHEEFKIDFGVNDRYLPPLSDEEASGDIPIPININKSLIMKSNPGGEDGSYRSNSSLYLRRPNSEDEYLETIPDSNNDEEGTRSSDSEGEDVLLRDGYRPRMSSEEE